MANTCLQSNTGFYDQVTGSSMNFPAGAFEIIHGDNRFGNNTGYSSVYFFKTFDVNYPPFQPQLFLAYQRLKRNVAFTVEINLWANIPSLYPHYAEFYVAYSKPGMPDRVFFAKPFPVTQNSGLTIPITEPTNDGIYYLWIWGTYPDRALWYEVYSVIVKY